MKRDPVLAPPPPVRQSSIKGTSGHASLSGGSRDSIHSIPLEEGPPILTPSSLAKRSSGLPPMAPKPPATPTSVSGDELEIGGLDYDVPRGKAQKGNHDSGMDYDIPRTKKECERATPTSPSKRFTGIEAGVAQAKRSPRNSSDESRPPSIASSVTSSLSHSSHGSGGNNSNVLVAQVVTVTKEDGGMVDYDIPRPSQHVIDAQLSLEQELDELEQQLILMDNQKKQQQQESLQQSQQQQKGSSGGLGIQSLKQGLGSNHSINGDDELSSHGSSDNLGVWDDVAYEEEEGEEASEQKEEVILDSWIKELESASKGMEALTKPVSKVIAEPAVADPQQSPPRVSPPLPAQPVQPAPPTPLSIVVETKSEEARRDDVTTRRKSQVSNNNPEKRRSKTEKQLQACNVSWRMSMRALADAGDPDLDELLADLCKLEEDTKIQLANAQEGSEGGPGGLRSPSTVLSEGRTVTNEDFVQFMQSLQSTKQLIQDPSKGLIYGDGSKSSARSATPDSGSSREEQKQQQQQQQQLQQEASNDIFNRPVSMMNAKPESRGSTLTRDSKSPKMPRKLESTVQTPLSPTHQSIQRQLNEFAGQLMIEESYTPEQQAMRLRNEKLRLAMLKLKEASVQKVVLKVFSIDGSSKMVAIHNGMNSRDVCLLLAERNHLDIGPNWTVVENITDLQLERTIEDHEKVYDALSHWPRNHNNSVTFKNNPEKYYLLLRPQLLMPANHIYSSVNTQRSLFTEEQKKTVILKEVFKDKLLPKIEGELSIREGKKGNWKKQYFALRASGLYYSKSGKAASGKDLTRLVEWKDVECFTGNQYKKFYRAPENYCFSLVPIGPLTKVESDIIHICCSTKHELMTWMTGVRLAKYGNQLLQDYEDTKAEFPWLQLEEENLDTYAKVSPPDSLWSKDPRMSAIPGDPKILQNGKEVGLVDLKIKRSTGSLSGSFQYKDSGNGGKAQEVHDTEAMGGSHFISGPLSQERRPSKRRQSPLAVAFSNAWKQGTLTAEMNQDTEKWPDFNPNAKQSVYATIRTKQAPSPSTSATDLFMEEMSGMVTLKKKPKDNEKGTIMDSPLVTRQESVGSIGLPSRPPQCPTPVRSSSAANIT